MESTRFLKRYSDAIPKVISFDNWTRPNRKWESPYLEKLYKLTNKIMAFPAPYFKPIENELYIQSIEEDEDQPILCLGCQDVSPGYESYRLTMTVNRKGWLKFLDALRYLRDQNYWFYIPSPTLNPGLPLRFELSEPYKGSPRDHAFLAIEMIRLELSEQIILDIWEFDRPPFSFKIDANCSGLLLISSWLHSFAQDQEKEREIRNHWTGYPEKPILPVLATLVLHRIEDEKFRDPIFSFQRKNEEHKVLHIFGNSSGFQKLSEVLENNAFSLNSSHWELEPAKKKIKPVLGPSPQKILPAEHFYSAKDWIISGGVSREKRYDPFQDSYSIEDFFTVRLPRVKIKHFRRR